MDAMLSLTSNTALSDGVAPDPKRIRPGFPYFGEPYENTGVDPKQASNA
jgi:hypothetical protein